MRIVEEICKEKNFDKEVESDFNRIVLDSSWQVNICKKDGLYYSIEGRSYGDLLKRIIPEIYDEKQNTPKRVPINLKELEKDKHILDNISMDQIEKIRSDEDFYSNIQTVYSATKVKEKNKAMNNHLKFLYRKLGLKVHFQEHHTFSKVLDFSEKTNTIYGVHYPSPPS